MSEKKELNVVFQGPTGNSKQFLAAAFAKFLREQGVKNISMGGLFVEDQDDAMLKQYVGGCDISSAEYLGFAEGLDINIIAITDPLSYISGGTLSTQERRKMFWDGGRVIPKKLNDLFEQNGLRAFYLGNFITVLDDCEIAAKVEVDFEDISIWLSLDSQVRAYIAAGRQVIS